MNVLKIETPQIVGLHRHRTELWHNKAPAVTRGGILGLIEKNHLCNRLNQDRNDLIEDIDQAIAIDAGPFPAHCPMHSETPGMIIDRLSILVLKIYHMAELAESV